MSLQEKSTSPGRRRRSSLQCWTRLEAPLQRFHAWKSQYQYLGRYSVEKLCAFHQYQEHTSLWRVLAVIIVSPFPPFLLLLTIDVVPMNDPRAGAAHNGVAFARSVIAHAVLPFAILLSTKQALQLSDRYFSLRHLLLIGVCISVVLEFFCVGAAFVWRFPVPFREIIAIPLFAVCVVFWMWYFGKDELRTKRSKLFHYLPMVTMQLSMYYSFLCLAVAFAYFTSTTQIILVLIFPMIKLGVKRAVWTQALKLDDLSTDVTICFVELTGALYQTVCLQYAKSHALQYMILFSDLVQAMYEVRMYVFHEYITDGVSTVQTAVRIVLDGVFPGADERSTMTTKKGGFPVFRMGTGLSVFLKPKMIQTMHGKRLLDLNQYKYEVDLPPTVDAMPDPVTPEPSTLEAKPLEEKEVVWPVLEPLPVGAPRHREVEIAPARRRSMDAAMILSMRSAASSGRSFYYNHTTTPNDSGYGISRATTGSGSIDNQMVSPPQAPTTRSSLTAFKPRLLPPLRRTGSQVATLSAISLSSDIKPGAFSVYDPSTTSAPNLEPQKSILATLIKVEADSPPATVEMPLVRRSSANGSFQTRRSRHSSATVHPDVSVFLQETGQHSVPERRQSLDTAPLERNEPQHIADQRVTRVMIDGIQLPRRDQARILEQTLQLLFSCEVLVFVEFLEVLLPTIYGLVVGTLWPLYNARYNLLFIGMEYNNMISTVTGSFSYATLESLSLGVMVYVMKKRYGFSPLHLLAFVLETYWKVLYGKLIGSFLVIWLSLTVHLGTDFTFTYDYGVILHRFGSSRFKTNST